MVSSRKFSFEKIASEALTGNSDVDNYIRH
jgi:hypothetical protein